MLASTRRSSWSTLALMLCAAVAAALLATPAAAFGVVSIDYGTEWIKSALAKPGLPFDVVLGRDSKRKIQASAAFKGKQPVDGKIEKLERLLGADAYSHASRDPAQSFHAAKLLLGRACADGMPPSVDMYHRVFGNEVVPAPADRNGSTCLVRAGREGAPTLSPEELVGMQLDHIRELAEETAGEQLSIGYTGAFKNVFSAQQGLDTAMTVPVFFTAAERYAAWNSAVLAGFRPRLVSDSAAVAVSYAQSRAFPKPETHIFYDVGSGSTRAALVEFSTEQVAAESFTSIKTPRELTRIRVLDATWERDAGGLALDMLLRERLASEFDKQHASELGGRSIRDDARAMARLLREANRVKHVLSANAAATSNAESLMMDLDLRTTVHRDEFEELMRQHKLLDRFAGPLPELLKRTGRSLAQIDSVVLVGGTTRVPAVQAALRRAGVPDGKLAQNVNADEAAAMGAALYGASFQPQLRMKPIAVEDLNVYPVELRDAHGHVQQLLGAGPVDSTEFLLQDKGITDDRTLELNYAPEARQRLPQDDNGRLFRVHLSGIAQELQELKQSNQLGNVDTVMNTTITAHPMGTYQVEAVDLVVKPPAASLAGALRSFFGLGEEKPSSSASSSTSTSTSSSASGQASSSSSSSASASPSANATAPPAPKERVIEVLHTVEHTGRVRPLGGTNRINAIEFVRLVHFETLARVRREEQFNQLEASIYRARDVVNDPAFVQASKDSERQTIQRTADELGAWLSEEGERADEELLTKKHKQLTRLLDPVGVRIDQNKKRTASVTALREALDEVKVFVAEARTNLSEALKESRSSKYSVTELDALSTQASKDRSWLEDGMKKQASRGPDEDPVLLSADMDRRTKKLRDAVKRLVKRRIAKTRPKTSQAKPASASSSSSASTTPAASSASTTPAASSTPASSTAASSTASPVHDEL